MPGRPLLEDPQPSPHDTRHTCGTRLADEGVPQHDIMPLMGHKDPRASGRYVHSNEARFDRAREAMKRARAGAA
jgi:integrase